MRHKLGFALKILREFKNNQNGVILALFVFLISPIIVLMGLSIDISYGFSQKQKLYAAASAAARAGAANGNGNLTTIQAQAQQVFNGSTVGMSNVASPTITYASSTNTVTVTSSVTVANLFMNMAGIPNSTYNVSASYTYYPPNPCFYSLNTSASGSISLGGSGIINITGCGIYANSSSSSAVSLSGSTSITATSLSIVGNYSKGSSSTITANPLTTGASVVANPLAGTAIPSYSSCDYNNKSVSTSQTLNPGVYCNGLSITGGAVTLNPGQYIIDGGTFNVSSIGIVTGNNVTIILTKKLSSSYATFSMGNSGVLNLTAPTGNTASAFNGVAIFQDLTAPTSDTNSITGSALLNVSGIIAFPNQKISVGNSGKITSPTCNFIIADQINLTGSGIINMTCPSGLISTYLYSPRV